VVVDAGVDASAYYEGHVPGALAISWLDDLNEPDRRGVPSLERTERLLGMLGISPDTHVVLYGEDDNRYAAYTFWVMRYYGHRRLSLLDGGRAAWLAAGAPLSRAAAEATPTRYVSAGTDESVRITRDALLASHVGAPAGTAVLDCRTESEYLGHAHGVVDLPVLRHRLGGHVPGAHHLAHRDLLDPATARFRPAAELAELFAGSGVRQEQDVVLYCDVGDRSALGWFALHELLGHARARNYDGGWSEYGSLVGAPVCR
jgi:thiosulfate/3-mercaptopyruvate sulfurtransferase